jgi:hypothetical protein
LPRGAATGVRLIGEQRQALLEMRNGRLVGRREFLAEIRGERLGGFERLVEPSSL